MEKKRRIKKVGETIIRVQNSNNLSDSLIYDLEDTN